MRMRHLATDPGVGHDQAGPEAAGQQERAGGSRVPGWLVPAVTAVAELVVGGYRIAGPSLWRDEAATISGSQRPAGAIWALVRNQDAVHGLYYLLMHVVIAAGGTSETMLRLPSLVAMSAAVAVTAVLGRRLARSTGLPRPELVGLLAGALLIAVPLTTRYAQEARPYALTTLFAVLATYLLLRGAASGRRSWWAGYAAALALTGLFNLFAVLLAAAHGVSLVAAARPSARSRDAEYRAARAAGAVPGAPAQAGSAARTAIARSGWASAHAAATAAPIETPPTPIGPSRAASSRADR